MSPEHEVFGPESCPRPDAEICFAESYEAGQGDEGVGRKMMGLELEKIKESTKEGASRKAEATLKMSNKNNIFTFTKLAFR